MQADIDTAIQRCLTHQQWILGPEVQEFETKVAQYLSVTDCVGVSSGTDALVIALRALAINRRGKEYFDRTDKIITTPLTFTATGDAILRAGATPVFVDIDPVTFNIDPKQVREYLHKNPSGTVGIIPVHLYGQGCDMDALMAIAKEYNLFVVEDAAQAMGGIWKNRKLGTIGNLGAFSFFPSKNLGGFGDAGMIATNDASLAELVRMLTKHGGKDKYNVEHIGYNARLDTLQAAILLAKLKYLDQFNAKRRYIATTYNEKLQCKDFILPVITPGHVFHQYTIRVLNGRRSEFQQHCKTEGIDTMVYYPVLLPEMNVFKNRCVSYNLTQAERIVQEVISLPIEPLSAENVMQYIPKIQNFK
jgi:dTDP-4-amino-4,6-dideoxygalactose transaminase